MIKCIFTHLSLCWYSISIFKNREENNVLYCWGWNVVLWTQKCCDTLKQINKGEHEMQRQNYHSSFRSWREEHIHWMSVESWMSDFHVFHRLRFDWSSFSCLALSHCPSSSSAAVQGTRLDICLAPNVHMTVTYANSHLSSANVTEILCRRLKGSLSCRHISGVIKVFKRQSSGLDHLEEAMFLFLWTART